MASILRSSRVSLRFSVEVVILLSFVFSSSRDAVEVGVVGVLRPPEIGLVQASSLLLTEFVGSIASTSLGELMVAVTAVVDTTGTEVEVLRSFALVTPRLLAFWGVLNGDFFASDGVGDNRATGTFLTGLVTSGGPDGEGVETTACDGACDSNVMDC